VLTVAFEDVPQFDINSEVYSDWLCKVATIEKKEIDCLNIVFCSDEFLLKINQEYLNHDFYTDIITFDYSYDHYLSGELYVSIDRVNENAIQYKTTFLNELNRVIVHGVLHLCGYKDKTKKDERLMRIKEDEMLVLF